MVHSSQSVLQIWLVNGWVSPKNLSSNCSRWLVTRNHQSSLSMRLIPSAEVEVKERTTLQEELKPSSSFKCKVLEMIWTVFWSLELLMSHGNSIMLLEEDLKRESIFRFLKQMLELSVSNLRQVKQKIIALKKTGRSLVKQLKVIQVPIVEQLLRKLLWCQLESARLPRDISKPLMVDGLQPILQTHKVKIWLSCKCSLIYLDALISLLMTTWQLFLELNHPSMQMIFKNTSSGQRSSVRTVERLYHQMLRPYTNKIYF